MAEKTTEELIAEAERLLHKDKPPRRGLIKKGVALIVLFIVFMVVSAFIYGFLSGYTEVESGNTKVGKPLYSLGDIVDDNLSSTCPLIILYYERTTDKYEFRAIEPIDNVWVFSPKSEREWSDRRGIEYYYPFIIGHQDNLSEILDYEYYNSLKLKRALDAIPKYKNGTKSYKYISDLERDLMLFPLDKYYEVGVSDCSELSAYMEWWLESHGVHAYIVQGEALPHPEITAGGYVYGEDEEGGPHAWVVVSMGTSFIIECTGVYIVPNELKQYYKSEYVFENLSDLVTYYYEQNYDALDVLEEYDWWVGLPPEFKHFEIVTYHV